MGEAGGGGNVRGGGGTTEIAARHLAVRPSARPDPQHARFTRQQVSSTIILNLLIRLGAEIGCRCNLFFFPSAARWGAGTKTKKKKSCERCDTAVVPNQEVCE